MTTATNSLSLPEPKRRNPPDFSTIEEADAWLAAQPQAQATDMVKRIGVQVEAIDGANFPPALAIALLDRLHRVAIAPLTSLEGRYQRKPLPLPAEDRRCFELSQRLWRTFGVAYLRQALLFPPAESVHALHRAVSDLRLAQLCHFQAAEACPAILDRLIFGVLTLGDRNRVLRTPYRDRDFPQFGESNLAGHLAWAFLLRQLDPYRLTGAQLTVANRTLGRWRELPAFQSDPGEPPDDALDLDMLAEGNFPEGLPRWLNVEKIRLKIQQRVALLTRGESPESLKLGRELSASACIRLLNDIASHLTAAPVRLDHGSGEAELVFGAENIWGLLRGEPLDPGAVTADSTKLAHERIAMFGFDQVSALATAVKYVNVPGEFWTLSDSHATRAPDGGPRRQSPCLIGRMVDDEPQMGILTGLHTDSAGQLAARLQWIQEKIFAGRLQIPEVPEAARLPGFLISEGEHFTLIAPPSTAFRPGITVELSYRQTRQLKLGEVVERGVDFVRYAVTMA